MSKSRIADKPYPPYASFCITEKELDPQRITNKLGIKPDKSFKRGEIRNSDKRPWSHGLWLIDSSQHVKSINLLVHINWLMKKIEPAQTKLKTILKEETIDAKLSCFWIMPSSHEALVIEPKLLRQIAGLGIRLELDIYNSDH
jgi:hypothetical protein